MSYLIFGLVTSGSSGVLLFIFPIPILFVFLIYWMSKKILACSQEIKTGQKTITKTILIDKYQHHRPGRGGNRYILNTLEAEVSASKKLYKHLIVGQSISISISSVSKELLGVQLETGETIENV